MRLCQIECYGQNICHYFSIGFNIDLHVSVWVSETRLGVLIFWGLGVTTLAWGAYKNTLTLQK